MISLSIREDEKKNESFVTFLLTRKVLQNNKLTRVTRRDTDGRLRWQ